MGILGNMGNLADKLRIKGGLRHPDSVVKRKELYMSPKLSNLMTKPGDKKKPGWPIL